jgi:Peptidase A4 family
MRLLRYLLISGSAAAVAGALALSTGPATLTAAGPARAVHPAWHPPSARFLAAAQAALTRYLSHSHPSIELARPGTAVSNGLSRVGSYNWSGYADASLRRGSVSRGTFTRAAGRWTVPTVMCTPEDQISSNWVGLDGVTNTAVEQAGTVSWCYEGKAVYFSWFEMFPHPLVAVSHAVRPGDTISAAVSRRGTRYKLRLTDSSHPRAGFLRRSSCAARRCQDTSAEWIVERPAFLNTGVAPLADFTTTGFTAASQTHDGRTGKISGFRSVLKIKMFDSLARYLLSTAGALAGGGGTFTDTWHDSY